MKSWPVGGIYSNRIFVGLHDRRLTLGNTELISGAFGWHFALLADDGEEDGDELEVV